MPWPCYARRCTCDRPTDRPRRPRAQPQGRLPRPPARRAGGVHRAVRVRQVVPGVRHDLRRGPAPVRGVAVGVRPAVPRPDGQARRRLHRGSVPGGLDRPEVDHPQPAVDGRHDHRGLRLPAAAVGPGRASRTARSAASRSPGRPRSRSSTGCWSCRRAPGSRCSPRSSGSARASTPTCSASCRPRASPGPGSTARWSPCAEPPALEKKLKHTIEVVVDRLVAKPSAKRRLTDSVETALGLAGGIVLVDLVDEPEGRPERERRFSEQMACPNDTRCPPTSSSRGRSRSTPRSAPARSAPGSAPSSRSTPSCSCPTRTSPWREGAIAPWAQGSSDYFLRLMTRARRGSRVLRRRRPGGPCRSGPRRRCCTGRTTRSTSGSATGTAASARTRPGSRASSPSCSAGTAETESRLEPGALRGLHAGGAVPGLQGRPAEAGVAGGAGRRAIDRRRLQPADPRGRRRSWAAWSCPPGSGRSPSGCSRRSTPGWASCSTSGWSTSPSTAPRARCPAARRSGSGWPPRSAPAWSGVLYVLDEPSIGLHQRDNHRLIETLTRLRDLGNTLIVVEHDEDTIRAADWAVDIGPGRRRARRPDRALRHRRRTCSATRTR